MKTKNKNNETDSSIDYSRLIKIAESLKQKKQSAPAEQKKQNKFICNDPSPNKEWSEACERAIQVLGSSFSRRDLLRFTFNGYAFPFNEFSAFVDSWLGKSCEDGKLVATPALVMDEILFSKNNLVPAPKI
jgi:hypothetical protein